ncbi:DUF3341 domain-containing protein [Aureimonas leprariae]|uniref:DUF3341 domain-containing protein n=1 Tax=Plantimonas leprariae TaxID=2615207 RepID=A0A7V7PTG0_9HYPH|nr:DUF3341 domain-containing protein [Aureimonas leprariae]KAB0682976.1 DUF3341 domain-containing protein [Aureimonas leprariae]
MSERLLAEFASPEKLVAAARQTREASTFRVVDAYSPFAVEGLGEEIEDVGPIRIRRPMLAGGIAGALLGIVLQWYSATEILRVPAGGRSLASWPDFLFATFELTVFGAAVAGFVSLLAGCGLPRLHHPLFELPGFERATQDRFFLEVEAAGEADSAAARTWLSGLGALSVASVPR